MTQVNLEAGTNFFQLINLLANHEEDMILLARDGTPVVEMRPAARPPVSRRIGVAKGKFVIPEEYFDDWDREMEEMFEELERQDDFFEAPA